MNDIQDFTKQSVHALITDLCPLFEFTNSGQYPNIICAEWEIDAVPWASVKCRLQPYFNNFMEVLMHINEISIKSLKTCTVKRCNEKISKGYLNKHFICPYARSFQSNEIVKWYLLDDNRDLKNHFLDHERWALRCIVLLAN